MNEKLEKLLDNHGTKLASISSGLFWGTIDCISSGLPILTIGVPLYDKLKFFYHKKMFPKYPSDNFFEKQTIQDKIKGCISYSIGTSIPFAIKYHQEIINYTSNILDKLS